MGRVGTGLPRLGSRWTAFRSDESNGGSSAAAGGLASRLTRWSVLAHSGQRRQIEPLAPIAQWGAVNWLAQLRSASRSSDRRASLRAKRHVKESNGIMRPSSHLSRGRVSSRGT